MRHAHAHRPSVISRIVVLALGLLIGSAAQAQTSAIGGTPLAPLQDAYAGLLLATSNGQPLASGASVQSAVIYGYGFSRAGVSPITATLVLTGVDGATRRIPASLGPEPLAAMNYASLTDEQLTSAQGDQLVKAGWSAIVAGAENNGSWTPQSIELTFAALGSGATVPITGPSFTIASNAGLGALSTLTFVAQAPVSPILSGAQLPTGFLAGAAGTGPSFTATVAPMTGGRFVVRNYPAVPSGRYAIMLQGRNRYGLSSPDALIPVPVIYQRPEQEYAIAIPVLDDPNLAATSGIPMALSINNPFSNEQIVADFVGVPAQGGASLTAVFDTTTRAHRLSAELLSTTEATKLWIQLPDAPDLTIKQTSWSPANAIAASWNATAPVTAEIEPVQLPFRLAGIDRGNCTSLVIHVGNTEDVPIAAIPPGAPRSSLLCAVRWTQFPPGLTVNSRLSALTGKVPLSTAPAVLSYDLGVVFLDSLSGGFKFIKSVTKQSTLSIIDQVAPTASYVEDYMVRMAKGTKTGLVTFVGNNRHAGDLRLASDIPVEYSVQVGDGPVSTSTQRRATASIITNTQVTGAKSLVTVKSWWSDTPSRIHSFDLDYTAIPGNPLARITQITGVLTTTAPQVLVSFGAPSGRTVTYDATQHGTWKLAVQLRGATGWAQVASSTTASVLPDGTVTIQVPSLPLGMQTLRVLATLQDNVGLATEVASAPYQVQIHDGSPLAGSVAAKPPSGPASLQRPFTTQLTFTLANPRRSADIASVAWERSNDDGASWDVMPQRNTSLYLTFTEDTDALFRARATSRYFPEEFVTQSIEVQAFSTPQVDIVGPSSIIVSSGAANYTAVAPDALGNLIYSWSVLVRGALPASAITGVGAAFSWTPLVAGVAEIRLSARRSDAPENDARATTTVVKTVYAVAPIPPMPKIQADVYATSVEAGVPVSFTGSVVLPVAMASLSAKLRMQWVLPDGTTQAATNGGKVSTIFDATHRTLRLYAWFDGFESNKVGVEHNAYVWTYSFPTFTLRTQAINGADAPALLSVTAVPTSPVRVSPGDVLKLNWKLPPGAGTIVKTSGMTANISLTNPGVTTIGVDVVDARGNTRSAESVFTVLPPTELAIQFDSMRTDDDYGRAPLTVFAPLRLISVAKGDAPLTLSYALNGVTIYSGAYGNFSARPIKLPTAGSYQLTAILTTRLGATATATQPLSAVDGVAPVCTLATLSRTATNTTIEARCTVATGRVTRYEWRYSASPAVIVTGSRIVLRNAEPIAASGTLRACPDRGPCTDTPWSR